MRVRRFQLLERTDDFRRMRPPEYGELRDRLHRKEDSRAWRVRLRWRHFGPKNQGKEPITSQGCSSLTPRAARFAARPHNEKRRRGIGPSAAEHWPDRDAPRQSRVTSTGLSGIEQLR